MVGLMLAAAAMTVLPQSSVLADDTAGTDGTNRDDATVDVQILGFNDFHGQLDQPTGNVGGQAAGGIEYFASAMKSYRAQNPNTVVVSAGDMIGASPLISGLFHDEPTVESMNDIGLDFEGVGNHDFDEGITELKRMQNGGCHPVDGCQDGDGFAGGSFKFLSANVRNATTHETVFPAYGVKEFGGVKIAFIGVTLKGTPAIVSPAGIQGYEFLDEADTVNALVPELNAQGIHTIIVLLHQSAGSGGSGQQGFNGCNSTTNALVGRFDPEIDAVFSGHSHTSYNCVYNGRPVTQAGSQGKLITQLNMTLSTETGQPVSMVANNRIVTRTVTPDPNALALLTKYRTIAAPIASKVQGTITADLTRGGGASSAGEQLLGDVIADSHLWGAQSEGAQLAFMNTGGIRADLVYSQITGTEQPGEVTYAELFTVQPFGNNLETVTMTGLQIKRVLEQQFQGGTGILQVSKSLTYTQDRFKPVGSRINPDKMRLNGVKMDMDAEYRVAGNSFLIDGGDNYTVFAEGTNRTGGMVDNDATAAYFEEFSPIAPPVLNRIKRVDFAAPVATAEPTITGTPKVGETLTAHAATWPVAGASSFSWTVDDGEVGTGDTYEVAPGDVGKKVTLVETFTATSYDDATATADSDTIVKGDAPAAVTGPSITGTPKVGQTLTAHAGTWPVAGTSTFSWTIDDAEVGTGATYEVAPGDLGETVTLVETFATDSYEDGSATVDSDTITKGDAPAAATGPSITGTPKVGQTLTAHPGTWPVAGGASTFSWTVDDAEVGTGATYHVAPGDLGKEVGLVETYVAGGYEDGTATVDSATITKGDAPAAVTGPGITGTAVVGSTLTVTGGTWPRAGASTYAWSVNGTAVGTGASYAVKPADAGQVVTVTETFTAAGYTPATATATSGTVAKAAVSLDTSHGKAKKGKKVKVVITLTSSGVTVPGAVQLTYAGKKLGAVTLSDGRAVVKLPAHQAGKYALKVIYLGSTGFTDTRKTVTIRVK